MYINSVHLFCPSLRKGAYLVMLMTKKEYVDSMPEKSKKSLKHALKGKKRQIITAAAVVVLLVAAIGAGALLRWWQNGGSNGGNNNTGNTSASNGEGDALTQNDLPAVVKDAQDTAATAGSEESNKQIATSLPGASNDEKFELYLQQGLNFENEKKWSDALTSYKNAEAVKKTANVYESLGRVEENMGNKAAAISYYKQAIPLLNQNSPMYASYKQGLQDKITALGG